MPPTVFQMFSVAFDLLEVTSGHVLVKTTAALASAGDTVVITLDFFQVATIRIRCYILPRTCLPMGETMTIVVLMYMAAHNRQPNSRRYIPKATLGYRLAVSYRIIS